jgi:hypothetical protein
MSTSEYRSGLFAFEGDKLHVHFQTDHQWDHITWFTNTGLPASGPAYDSLLRGKTFIEEETGDIILAYYGTAFLSELRFEQLRQTFHFDADTVVERMLDEAY